MTPPAIDTDTDLHLLAEFIARHPRLAILSGAGISTGSGIPDYRDRDGVRRGKAPIEGPAFRASAAVRQRYWARSMVGWPTLRRAEPNPAHLALATLQAGGGLAGIVTQNVDGLHQQAGSSGVIELHGNIHRVACLACGARFDRGVIQALLERGNPALLGATAQAAPDGDAHLEPEALAEFHVPPCPHCGGMLSPDVVFFGDGVPPERTRATEQLLAGADALLVVGSSLMVYSGYRLCKLMAEAGKPLAALNLGTTRADALLGLKIERSAEAALPALLHLLRPE